MNIGQTSLIVFLSKLAGSALGFIATIYFARVLGAEVLGIYAVIMSTVAWLQTGGKMGIAKATNKRISEGEDRGKFLVAGIVSLVLFITAISLVAIAATPFIESYLSDFENYSQTSVVYFILLLLAIKLVFIFVLEVLRGLHMVHIAGPLKPVKTATQSIIQLALVFAGLGLIGMLLGYFIGAIIVLLVAGVFLKIRPANPTSTHYQSLLNYAKFSWLGGLKSRALNDVDILILNAMVATGLVGIYSVVWSLSKFLDLFSSAIGETVFPEISKISKQQEIGEVKLLIEDAVAYAGLITIPGLVGGVVISDRLLQIYGPEFVQGVEILWMLLLAVLFFSYYRQFLNALNALDFPNLAFFSNIVFVVSNIVLNVILIWRFGWIGAAVASTLSILIGLVASYLLLIRIVTIEIPANEIGRQLVAAIAMGAIVAITRGTIESAGLIENNTIIVLGLVSLGTIVYTATLYQISPKFQTTVERNIPFNVPFRQ
ncbi:oligosaccharide flippase family protein [Natrarchaeobaculum aegyptiacum]|uniref:Uncharacterized protein n=1 Tax=Natrarchaeobaculum aegyptiacum TaxID=745377 RepID=A0A2Z2I280_9EURY|nr:oligosaccharide flippase family protein [Natrarchaeobaculum aegyptiacum]ARS90818.1 hypothetical protein B1756_14535 [Natrarchaeobaculum aegyptiacum]